MAQMSHVPRFIDVWLDTSIFFCVPVHDLLHLASSSSSYRTVVLQEKLWQKIRKPGKEIGHACVDSVLLEASLRGYRLLYWRAFYMRPGLLFSRPGVVSADPAHSFREPIIKRSAPFSEDHTWGFVEVYEYDLDECRGMVGCVRHHVPVKLVLRTVLEVDDLVESFPERSLIEIDKVFPGKDPRNLLPVHARFVVQSGSSIVPVFDTRSGDRFGELCTQYLHHSPSESIEVKVGFNIIPDVPSDENTEPAEISVTLTDLDVEWRRLNGDENPLDAIGDGREGFQRLGDYHEANWAMRRPLVLAWKHGTLGVFDLNVIQTIANYLWFEGRQVEEVSEASDSDDQSDATSYEA